MGKNIKFKNKLYIAFKAIMIALTMYYSLAMPVLSGVGIIYNRASYGEKLTVIGIFFVISGLLMTTGAILCLFKKNLSNILSLIFSVIGCILCLSVLYSLAAHADAAGWTDNHTLTPISSMYKFRITPCIFPVLTAITIALTQLFSYELSESRRSRKINKEKKKNAPAPKILGDD